MSENTATPVPQRQTGPRPLAERPDPLETMSMITHRRKDGIVTHYEVTGGTAELTAQLDILTAALHAMTPSGAHNIVRGTIREAMAALSLQAAALMQTLMARDHGDDIDRHRELVRTYGSAYRALRGILDYLTAQRELKTEYDTTLTEEAAGQEVVEGYAYFEFNWQKLFDSIP